ncbi:MAG: hypothetical protein L3J39_04580 [Verrucomicrobiales bacterium]|nr:hypothetical protein [Verrucomicrobiales bacterium]
MSYPKQDPNDSQQRQAKYDGSGNTGSTSQRDSQQADPTNVRQDEEQKYSQYSGQGQIALENTQSDYTSPMGQSVYNTPFSESEKEMPKTGSVGGKAAVWAALGGVGTVVVLAIGYMVYSSIQDPFRTLDIFPTEKYLRNHESVVGSRFRLELTVVAELGGDFDKGRLLSFRDDASQRALAVLVSPDLGQVSFSKGQSYLAEIEVKNGGLIYAHAFRKN